MRIPTVVRVFLSLSAALLVPACGGGSNSSGAFSPYTPPTAFSVVQSATGIDVLMSAVAVPDGSGFYAAGFTSGTIVTPGTLLPRFVSVVKILNSGALDLSFNATGMVTTTLETTGANDEIDIVLQSQGPNAGKILVGTTQAVGADRNFAVIRLNTNGTLDTGFATAPVGNGIRSIDLTAGTTDVFRSLAVDPVDDAILIHGSTPATGISSGTGLARTDTDFIVFKLDANGDRVLSFAVTGLFQLDLNESSATPRAIKVMTDRTILASGYANAFGANPQPVLYKLSSAGARDTTFAGNGVYTGTPLETQTEVYNYAVHGDTIVTGGYGRESGDRNDWVSLRFSWRQPLPVPPNPKAGTRDLTWGGSPRGTSMINPSPSPTVGSNCRGAVALPDGKTLLFGSTGAGNTPGQDAVFAVLDASGYLDPTYGGAPHGYPLGTLNDQFWGAAAHATHAIVVGWRGAGAATGTPLPNQSAASNDDAFALILPIQ